MPALRHIAPGDFKGVRVAYIARSMEEVDDILPGQAAGTVQLRRRRRHKDFLGAAIPGYFAIRGEQCLDNRIQPVLDTGEAGRVVAALAEEV